MKKIHPADAADRAAIATATSFIATIFIGTGMFAKKEAATLEAARGEETALNAKFGNQTGRRALVYAILPSGAQVVVPKDYAATAINPSQPTTEQEPAMPTKSFPKRFNAQRFARSQLKNPKAEEGREFTTSKNAKGEWVVSIGVDQLANTAAGKANRETWNAIETIKRAAQKGKTPAQAKPEKSAKTAKAPKADKPAPGKRAAIEEAAKAGKLPPEPDFSAPTHARYRGKLAEVIKLAKAGDVKGLKAFQINPISTSPKAIDRYRNLAVIAIEARA